jgi:hypothetical protein
MARQNLDILRLNTWFYPLVMLIMVICIIQPALAVQGAVTISYRGAGGYIIGDVITFDGRNTVSNITLLKISGPDLPEAGVPVYNLNGVAGSGNSVPVNADGTWKFVWDTANIAGVEKLMTVRYTITAYDQSSPEKKASTSILLKKPGFYINPQTGSINPGDYVQVSGSAEQGVTYVKIEIVDPEGTVLHTFVSPVSGTGFFNYGFRADMQPGRYSVRVSNPALMDSLTTTLAVVSPGTNTTASTTAVITSSPAETVTVLTTAPPQQTATVGSSASLTPSIPLSPFIPVAGLVISGLIVIILRGSRKQ